MNESLMLPVEDLDHCRRQLAGGSRSFWLAGRLLPTATLDAATALYAFCRAADDLVDDGADPETALQSLKRRLDAIYESAPEPFPEDRALAALVQSVRLPRAPLDALLEGFRWDVEARRYATLEDVEAYGIRVAGSVGLLMAWILGERRSEPLARAIDLGVAMQLTNICRDVGEDAARGRCYLPLEDLQSLSRPLDAWLARPTVEAPVQASVARLLDRAEVLYRRAEQGIRCLPPRVSGSIRAAARLYREIGRVVAERHYDSVSSRAVVPRLRQLTLLISALPPAARREADLLQPVLPVGRALYDAVLETRPGGAPLTMAAAAAEAEREQQPTGFAFMLDRLLELDERRATLSGASKRG